LQKKSNSEMMNPNCNLFSTFDFQKKIKMGQVTLKGNPVNTVGQLPQVGSQAKDFQLVKTDLSIASLSDFKGSKVVLNIFPSVDTSTCATSVRKFNEKASALDNTKVLCISRDLPFAQNRFCGAEGLENVVNLSDFKNASFGNDYGLTITDGPLAGLHSRAVIILDENGIVKYTEQVPDIVDEPNYENALAAL
jgi:thiol peroxidase